MSLEDGGSGNSARHTLLGRREGSDGTAFSWDCIISGPPKWGQPFPLVSHLWKAPSQRCVSQGIPNQADDEDEPGHYPSGNSLL